MKCNICHNNADEIFSAKVLRKYTVKYYKCTTCSFVQTEKPYWLTEAYSSAITAQDIGLISRNNYYAPIVSLLIKFFFEADKKYLDYGGGYGIFVRLMRDRGFNFSRYDTYCKNIFSEGYEDDEHSKYELITAFEVFEHLENPTDEIEKMLLKSRNIFFSTELQPPKFFKEEDWWYVMANTGQHISFYSLATLQLIAKKYNLNLYSNGRTFHLLTQKKISSSLFKLLINRYSEKILNKLFKNPPSLLMQDYQKIANEN